MRSQPRFPEGEENSLSGSGGMSEPSPENSEEDRIASLLGFQILDTPADPLLNVLTEMAAAFCETPIALIALADRERVWFKSAFGTEIKETKLKDTIFSYATDNGDQSLIIPDTLLDPRFCSDSLVRGDLDIRFFAGAQLLGNDGVPIGCFCVIDRKPKELTARQIATLEKLSLLTMDYLETHKSLTNLTHRLHLEKEVYNGLLKATSQLVTTAPTFDDALNSFVGDLDCNLGWLSARIRNMQTGGTTGVYYNESIPRDPELPSVWTAIDSTPSNPLSEITHAEFISSAPRRPEYSYLIVPVRIRNRLVAVLEFLYPDHHCLDPRIMEVFDLIATNLSIIAERELINKDLRYQADHDLLTGAASRIVILKKLEEAINEVDSLHPDSILLYIDIDGFKEVNDNFGHDTGDELLIEITKRFDGISRNKHLLGRLSGDEFTLLIRHLNLEEELPPFLARIQEDFARSFILGDLEIMVTASIGCVVISEPDIKPTEVLRRAEEAMYLVKSGQRKGVCIADEELIRKFKVRRNLDRKIKDAFASNRFSLVFQPLFDLHTNSICGAEALLRLNEKDGTVLAAGNFMAAIERTKYLPKVDEWVLGEAIHTFKGEAHSLLNNMGFRVALNVSPAVLSTKGYAGLCLEQLQNAGIPPQSLTLEIVESNLIPSNRTLLDNLKVLRKQGICIAVDDFGTGYSTLQHLSLLPIDIIKIDRMFLKGILSGDSKKNALLAAIVGIGKNLGYTVIGEGVEEQPQSDHLHSLGCRYVQGYLYGKPMPIKEFLSFVQKPVASPQILFAYPK